MIQFVISRQFDYENYMLDDAGPRFASGYNWTTQTIDFSAFSSGGVYVIDWHLTGAEFAEVGKAIERHRDALFAFHVVDPWPHIRGAAAFAYLMGRGPAPNVVMSGPYPPTEHAAALYVALGSRFVHTPYLYEPEREVALDHTARKPQILVTGNIGLPDYPVRASIVAHGNANPMFFDKVRRLQHSGYDASRLRHRFIRDAYIRKLAEHRFAAVCSSRLRLEFLKYREIAYAGCAPVGDLPGTLSDCPPEGFVPWRRNVLATRRAISPSRSEDVARTFRAFMAKARDREFWRARVAHRFAANARMLVA